MSKNLQTISRKLRARRDTRDFYRALDTASPAMRHELIAAAARAQR